jgi:hypothetical protein
MKNFPLVKITKREARRRYDAGEYIAVANDQYRDGTPGAAFTRDDMDGASFDHVAKISTDSRRPSAVFWSKPEPEPEQAVSSQAIARVHYTHETDDDFGRYDHDVYTEQALARTVAEYRTRYAEVYADRTPYRRRNLELVLANMHVPGEITGEDAQVAATTWYLNEHGERVHRVEVLISGHCDRPFKIVTRRHLYGTRHESTAVGLASTPRGAAKIAEIVLEEEGQRLASILHH